MSHQPNRHIPPLSLGVVRQIKTTTGVDLLRAYDPEVMARIDGDPVLCGRIIAIAGGQAELEGQDLAEAHESFLKALIEFFPKRSIYDDFNDSSQTETAAQVDPWRVVFRAAGAAGVEPWGYSFRELIWMAQGAWEPHAVSIANTINMNLKKGASPLDPDTVNPWHPKRPRPKRTRKDARTSKG